jgi:hypothetical protein
LDLLFGWHVRRWCLLGQSAIEHSWHYDPLPASFASAFAASVFLPDAELLTAGGAVEFNHRLGFDGSYSVRLPLRGTSIGFAIGSHASLLGRICINHIAVPSDGWDNVRTALFMTAFGLRGSRFFF